MWAAAALALALVPSLSYPHTFTHSLARSHSAVVTGYGCCCCAATAAAAATAADLINSECQQLQQIDLNRTKNQIKLNEMKSKRISICVRSPLRIYMYIICMCMLYALLMNDYTTCGPINGDKCVPTLSHL